MVSPAVVPPSLKGSIMSAAKEMADAIRSELPGWVEDQLHGFFWLFGDPQEPSPGRQVVVDGLGDHPVIRANSLGIHTVIHLPRVSGIDDRERVIGALRALDVIGER